ncbi:unnamed protein product, partial [Mesorhabditis belari]|uniref:Phosphatidylinositol glycan anchor biosynthesis class U protein n=1 Tax=Mesorhabditis belari TaxID=2138241 RepID=A0AAF3J7M8_9BILA
MLRRRGTRNTGHEEQSELETTYYADAEGPNLTETLQSENETDEIYDATQTFGGPYSFFGRNCSYIAIAILCRVAAVLLFHNFLISQPEWTSPLVSIKNLRDGVILERESLTSAAGNLIRMLPSVIFFFNKVIDVSSFPLLIIFHIFFDIVTAYLLSKAAFKIQGDSTVAQIVAKCFLLNPLAIGSCACLNLTTFHNALLATVVYFFAQGSAMLSSFFLGLATVSQMFPVTLIASIWIQFSDWKQIIKSIIGFTAGVSLYLGINYVLSGNTWGFASNIYGFMVNYEDLKPNCGLFWYFYSQVFEHFRTFYEYVFLANSFLYVLPLTLALRSDPVLHLTLSLLLLVTLSPYPTLGDAAIYMALLPLQQRHFKSLRYSLLIACTITTCVCLMPIMWHMWVVSGSGNANFYFAVTLIYNVAQLYILLDLLMAYFRAEVTEVIPEEITEGTNFVLH